MYTHSKQLITAGIPIDQAKKALIMLHGRGATAQGIIGLTNHFNLAATTIIAPQATEHSWYPYSFMAPVEDNEPALGSALALIDNVVTDIVSKGIAKSHIYFLGFSQGACLTLEYVTRNANEYGGAVAFTGGLIGQKLAIENYKGDFKHTPVLITTGDHDIHVPLTRVEESVAIIKGMNANVRLNVYKGRPHTITTHELDLAVQHVFQNKI